MSSILDAVTRDGSRSGAIPGAASPAPAPPAAGGGGRWKAAAMVIVVGVLAGAVAARLFGGSEPAPDDLLTERSAAPVAAGSTAKPGANGVAVAPVVADGSTAASSAKAGTRDEDQTRGKAPKAAGRKKDEAGAPTAGVGPAGRPAEGPKVASLRGAAAPTNPAPAIVASPVPTAESPPETVASAVASEAGAPPAGADAGTEPEELTTEAPSGAPAVTILFVAWSRLPAERLASMRVGTGSLSVVHEGEYVEGLQVSAIHPESVDFQWTGQKFRVPVREF